MGKQASHGQTLLSLVLVIGTIVVAIGAIFVIVAAATSSSSFTYRASQAAQTAANAGIEDAMLQLTRNGAFASAGYGLTVGSTTATVVVLQATPAPGSVTVTSAATVGTVTRKLSALFSENTTTEQVNLVNIQTVQ